jgi:serine/threonine protein kinase
MNHSDPTAPWRIHRPVYVSAPEEGVPIDIQSLEAEVFFDVASQTADVAARMKFRVGNNSGRPIFDLLQDIDSARLDGSKVAVCDFRYDGLPSDRSQRPRVIDCSLAAGSTHTLELHYSLSQFSAAARQQPLIWQHLIWLAAPRGLRWVCFTTLQSGGYLETWFPSNMLYDEFSFTADVRLANAESAHALVTNGSVTELGAQHWRTKWLASDPIFPPVLVISPASSLESFTVSFAGPATSIPKIESIDSARISSLRRSKPEIHELPIRGPRGSPPTGEALRPARDTAAENAPALSPGDRLGPYKILAEIGAGGMGKVYRARDSRMGREVAIKVVADRFLERFSREVCAIAALNHPNICTVYDVGPNYLVMELVEGPTLAERIADGPVAFHDALGIAMQIADALEAAHLKGIVHRDLKSGNIKFTSSGIVKVLDFGLAKLSCPAPDERGDSLQSHTLSLGPTEVGIILGTAAYMAPEQARGKTTDRRADIWAFGVVVYEMLTGKRLFQGETVSDILAAVLRQELAWEPIPPQAQRLLKSCLERDPKLRLHDIADARLLLLDEPPAPDLVTKSTGFWPWLTSRGRRSGDLQ